MNDDPKTKILLFAALFLTFLYFFLLLAPPPSHDQGERRVPKPRPASQEKALPPAPSPSLPPSSGERSAPLEKESLPSDLPPPSLEIRILTPKYEAVFTTRGGSLRSYRLLEFRTTPDKKSPTLLLLDEIAPGKRSLLLDTLSWSKADAASSPETVEVLSRILRDHPFHLLSAPQDAILPEGVEVPRNTQRELIFRQTVEGWEITKIFRFPSPKAGSEPLTPGSETPYGFDLDVIFRNLDRETRAVSYTLVGPSGIIPDDRGSQWAMLEGVSAALPSKDAVHAQPVRTPLAKLEEHPSGELATFDRRGLLAWIGLSNRFFSSLLLVQDPTLTLKGEHRGFSVDAGYLQRYPLVASFLMPQGRNAEAVLHVNRVLVTGGEGIHHRYRFYAGPAADDCVAFDPRLTELVSYTISWFAPISRLLVKILNAIGGAVGNYGLAIILVTLLVKTILHPLTRKAMVSGHKMQKIQPLMKQIRERYKNDPQKLNQETMRLFREHEVSPMGGCLPMLIQMPIFLALYGAFSRGFVFRQASFLWIQDLSHPDRLLTWDTEIPLLSWVTGNSLNLLPLLYLGLNLLQMRMQPQSDDPQIQQQQQMMKFMPIFFVFLFYSMPAGLVLYFAVQSLYSLLEQWIIKRGLEREESPAAYRTLTSADGKAQAPRIAAGVGFEETSKRKNR